METDRDRERRDGGMWMKAGRGEEVGERWRVGGF